MTTDRNPLGNFLGAARDGRVQQQAFNNEMRIADLQLRAQAQSAHLNQLAGLGDSLFNQAFGGQAGTPFGAAMGQITGGIIEPSTSVKVDVEKAPAARSIREILQAEIDEWLAPITI